jgi:hypothetical protein
LVTRSPKETTVSKLFLSCDLTGSTAFKQRVNADPSTPWQKVFLQFYREFPQQLYSQQTLLGFTNLSFDLWKAVGDELIFTCKVASEVEVFQAVEVWVATLRAFKSDNLDGHPQLGVKGGAFVGTFPGPDYESTIPLKPDIETSDKDVVLLNVEALSGRRAVTKYLYDYFGPSIDTGFRVLSKCSDRYMTLSLEVAYALAVLHNMPNRDGAQYERPDLMLLESLELKGVWGGKEYPLFAIDLHSGDGVSRLLARESVAGLNHPIHEVPWPTLFRARLAVVERREDRDDPRLLVVLESSDRRADGLSGSDRRGDYVSWT